MCFVPELRDTLTTTIKCALLLQVQSSCITPFHFHYLAVDRVSSCEAKVKVVTLSQLCGNQMQNKCVTFIEHCLGGNSFGDILPCG